MGNSDSKIPQLSAETAIERRLPTALTAVYEKHITKIICLLSESDARQASFTISLPYGWWGHMIFYDGPSDQHPVLVTTKDESKMGNKLSVMLPASPKEGVESRPELVKWQTLSGKERYWFGLEVGHGAQRHLQRFEWRHSHGAEVHNLGGSKWGWKLVRLGPQAGSDDGKASSTEALASDGGEIVAVWADAKGLSMTRIGEFRLMGSGATGELGQSFSLMALVSCMIIWQTTMRVAST